MGLPFHASDLDEVPESARELYEETDDGYRLPVEGVEPDDEVAKLRRAHERVKEERNELRSKASKFSEDDLEELERLRELERKREEEEAKAEGRWEDLRDRLKQEHEQEKDELRSTLQSRDQVIEDLTVTSELRSAIAQSGVKPEYQGAVEALLMRRGPEVKWRDGKPVGVFEDEIHGATPIAEYVEAWAESDEAEPYMPVSNAGGGGGSGEDRGGPKPPDKEYGEMGQDEKVAYLEDKYGATSGV